MTPLRPMARLHMHGTRAQPHDLHAKFHFMHLKLAVTQKNINPKNTNKSAIHENADANITCDFCDSDISRLGFGYLIHAIGTSLARL